MSRSEAEVRTVRTRGTGSGGLRSQFQRGFTPCARVVVIWHGQCIGGLEAGRPALMFSWLTDISRDGVHPEAIWAVIGSARAGRVSQSWAALVSAVTWPVTGDFAFESDARLGVGDSLLVRYHDQKLDRMVTKPATVIVRVDPPGQLSRLRVLIDECECGAVDCEASTCFEAGRFVKRRAPLRALA
jgi:hypothetical protein